MAHYQTAQKKLLLNFLQAHSQEAFSIEELAARLEERGLITRERDERDKRRILLHLTDAGRKMAGQGAQVGDAELFACLSAEEQDALRVILNKIVDAHNTWKKARGFR